MTWCTDADLAVYEHDIGEYRISGAADFSAQRGAAAAEINERLRSKYGETDTASIAADSAAGEALKRAEVFKTLELVFAAHSGAPGDVFDLKRQRYQKNFEREMSFLSTDGLSEGVDRSAADVFLGRA